MLYRGLNLGFFGWIGLLLPSLAIGSAAAWLWYYYACPYFGFGPGVSGITAFCFMLGVKTAVRELIVCLAVAARSVPSTTLRLLLRLLEAAIIAAPVVAATVWLKAHGGNADAERSALVLGGLVIAANLAATTAAFMEFND